MIELPKLVLLLLIGGLVWYAVRWLNGPQSRTRQPPPRQPRPRAIEDLVACRKCGTYVAAGAGCGKPDCPQPR